MALDVRRNEIVLSGGFGNGSSILSRTWIWDGANWVQRTPERKPSPRANASMAYDEMYGSMILFGGSEVFGENPDLGDTWVWDGVNWTEQIHAIAPHARSVAAMAYDAARQQIVLFGGHSFATGTLGDTWTYSTPPRLDALTPHPHFSLDAIRPNPATRNHLSVLFMLGPTGSARLELLDVTGRHIATRELGFLGGGRHEVDLAHGESLITGLYFLRLTQGTNTATQRVCVLN